MVAEKFLIKKHTDSTTKLDYYNSTTKEFDLFDNATKYPTYPEALERVNKLSTGIYKIVKVFEVN